MADDTGSDGGRSTAPMSEFTNGQVAIGVVVLAVGLALAFGVPLVLAA